jgi:hypothetical protein
MTNNIFNEEESLIFVRSAFEVSAGQYEKILTQRAAGTRQRMTVKKKWLLQEIAYLHQRLGELIEHVHSAK